MLSIKAIMFGAMALAFAAPAYAQDANVRCVQQYLKQEGFPITVADGLFGPNTQGAAAQFLAAQGADLPELTRENAAIWCDALMPSQIHYVADDGVDNSFSANVKKGAQQAEMFLAQHFGETATQPVTAFMSPNAAYLANAYKQTVGNRNDFSANCNPNAVYGWYSMYFCTNSDIWSRGSTFIQEVAAHEYWHVMQSQWIGEAARPCCTTNTGITIFGPEWLKEGGAQYIAYRATKSGINRELANRARDAREGSAISEYISRAGLRRDGDVANAAGFIGTHYLVTEEGYGSLRTFYQNIGTGMSYQNAFASAFGRTIEQFDVDFAEYLTRL